MEQTPDLGGFVAYVILMVYYLLILGLCLTPPNDAEAEDKTPKPQVPKPPGGHALARTVGGLGTGYEAGPSRDTLPDVARPADGFSDKEFLSGATRAYELILEAFAAGDLDTLGGLLDPSVFDSFKNAILERRAREEETSLSIISIKTADILSRDMEAGRAEVTVRFVSEQITATYGKNGDVVTGDPARVVTAADRWRFARDPASPDPNWTLVAADGD